MSRAVRVGIVKPQITTRRQHQRQLLAANDLYARSELDAVTTGYVVTELGVKRGLLARVGAVVAATCTDVLFASVAGLVVVLWPSDIAREPLRRCLPCRPVGVGGLAYEYHSVEQGNVPHNGMLQHTHHFKMNQSPPAAGCVCFWHRDFIKPTRGFSPLSGAVPVQPAAGGGIAP